MSNALYIGVMSGTSADGIDVVLAHIDDNSFELIDSVSAPYSDKLRKEIKALSSPGPDEISRAATLGIQLSEITAELIKKLLKQTNFDAPAIRAIGYHGQTIRHQPTIQPPYSVQIGCPSTLAFKTGITTITDFRMADIAAGGQGAPLVPAFHQDAFQTSKEHRIILNIGGIANISYLPKDTDQAVIGFDTGPGNTLLDEWISLHQGKCFDENGDWAATGELLPQLLSSMMSDDYLQQPLPKSTGKEHFNLTWLAKHMSTLASYTHEDIQRTLVEFSACSIAREINNLLPLESRNNCHIFACGGGIHNKTLMLSLKRQLPDIKISSTDELGIPPQLVEGSAFAWLARQTLEGKPGNLPSVTGASNRRILGGIYLN